MAKVFNLNRIQKTDLCRKTKGAAVFKESAAPFVWNFILLLIAETWLLILQGSGQCRIRKSQKLPQNGSCCLLRHNG